MDGWTEVSIQGHAHFDHVRTSALVALEAKDIVAAARSRTLSLQLGAGCPFIACRQKTVRIEGDAHLERAGSKAWAGRQ
eukprot:191952-Chlamydomonas_euryale.AAC.1